MKNSPLYENLNTSFVNLAALVRYLQRNDFAGRLHLALNEYEAEIVFSDENKIVGREQDSRAGRIAEGEEALQRIYIRARESGGIINVYQTNAAPETANQNEFSASANSFAKAKIAAPETTQNEIASAAPKSFAAADKKTAENAFDEMPLETNSKTNEFPFEFTNRVEAKARQNQLSADDWATMTNLFSEILRTVDDSLAEAQLDFSAAFQKACAEISSDYPFLKPETENLKYEKGVITVREPINAKLFAAALNEALRRIFEKLAANPNFDEVHRATVQKIIALVHRRKPIYERFFITPQLEKNLGI